MSIGSQFAFIGQSTEVLVNAYDLFMRNKACLSETEEFRRQAIATELMENRLQLIELSPDSCHENLVSQLVGNDKVHNVGVSTIGDIYRYRIGGNRASKTAFALVWPDHSDGPKVMAAIYVNRRQGLGENVHEILTADIEDANGFDCFSAFSISNFGIMKGEGQLLIFSLHKYLRENSSEHCKITTISPFRSFARFLESSSINSETNQDLKSLAISHIRSNINPVGKFHRGNGAIAVEVQMDANIKGSDDAVQGRGVMVNYLYPRSESALLRNISLYNQGQYDVLMSPRLREIVGLSREVDFRGAALAL
ncbi:MAG: malonyl-CoA decarboxylase family protein [Alphaproteobacteria bacterium]|nr:malonyl-CoA decarboxylase family protein [Alphaproteobacteria bacterium]